MRNITDLISEDKKTDFKVLVKIQLENTTMDSELCIRETTSSYAKEQAIKTLKENNVNSFEIVSIVETNKIIRENNNFRENELDGKRIKLIQMGGNDPSPVEPGSEGTVLYVDDIGQLHMRWDNGGGLALIPGVDDYEVMESEQSLEEEII